MKIRIKNKVNFILLFPFILLYPLVIIQNNNTFLYKKSPNYIIIYKLKENNFILINLCKNKNFNSLALKLNTISIIFTSQRHLSHYALDFDVKKSLKKLKTYVKKYKTKIRKPLFIILKSFIFIFKFIFTVKNKTVCNYLLNLNIKIFPIIIFKKNASLMIHSIRFSKAELIKIFVNILIFYNKNFPLVKFNVITILEYIYIVNNKKLLDKIVIIKDFISIWFKKKIGLVFYFERFYIIYLKKEIPLQIQKGATSKSILLMLDLYNYNNNITNVFFYFKEIILLNYEKLIAFECFTTLMTDEDNYYGKKKMLLKEKIRLNSLFNLNSNLLKAIEKYKNICLSEHYKEYSKDIIVLELYGLRLEDIIKFNFFYYVKFDIISNNNIKDNFFLLVDERKKEWENKYKVSYKFIPEADDEEWYT